MKALLTIVVTLLLLPLPSFALLHYQGETSLYEDTVWEGEVLIDGILTVAMGTTLEIRPGTVIRFTRFDSNSDQIGEHELFIQGRLLARGTADQPILFTSAEQEPRTADWGALNMMMSEEGENLLEHCIVEYAYRGFHAHFSRGVLKNSLFRLNQRGAQFQESEVVVENCEFISNFNGLQFRDSAVTLRDNRIRDNHWGVRAVFVKLRLEGCEITGNRVNGISLRDSEFTISNNLLSDNRRGLYLQRSRGQASRNRIVKNREHGIYLEDSIADLHGNLLADNGRSGLKVLNSGGLVQANRFSKNHQFSLVNAGQDDFALDVNRFDSPKAKVLDRQTRSEIGRFEMNTPVTQLPTPVQ